MRTSCRRQCVLVGWVCVCVCYFSPSLCGKKLTPIPHQQTSLHSPSPPLLPSPLPPHYVLFTPLEAARLPVLLLLFHRAMLTWPQCVPPRPGAVFIIPAFACLPFRETLLCLERQRKTVVSKKRRLPPATQMDHKSFRTGHRGATQHLGVCSNTKLCDMKTY